MHRTTHTKTQEQVKKKVILFCKRKKHTVKNLYTANQNGLIVYKSKHRQRGSKHDYKVYKDNHPELSEDIERMYDLGFLGVQKDYPEQKSTLPIKRKRNQILTYEEAVYNKIILKEG